MGEKAICSGRIYGRNGSDRADRGVELVDKALDDHVIESRSISLEELVRGHIKEIYNKKTALIQRMEILVKKTSAMEGYDRASLVNADSFRILNRYSVRNNWSKRKARRMFKALGYHTFAKIVVVLAAYILHFFLGRILTLDEYGVVGTLISFCNFYYMFLTNGVRQGISKSLSVGRYRNLDVIRKGLFFQVAFSLALAGINYVSAPIFANAFGDSAFETYIRWISILIPMTAVYFAFTGGLNGMKLFLPEAVVISVYPMLRLLSVPIAYIMKNEKPVGIVIGFTLASMLSAILTAGFLFSNKKFRAGQERAEELTVKDMLHESFEFIVFFAAITLILNMDTFFLQYVCKDTALTGYYTGVHTFSLVPYYLISAFYLVILPYIAENHAKGNRKKVKEIIAENFNIIMVFILPITVLICVTAGELLSCFYKPDYYMAGRALSILCIGTFLLSSFAVLNVALNGMNCKKVSRIMSIVVVALDMIMLNVFIPLWGIEGAAMATTISALVGCIASVIYLVSKIGNPFDLRTIFRAVVIILIFGGVCRGVFSCIEITNLLALLAIYCVFGVAYLVCIMVFRIVDVKKIAERLKNRKSV